MTATAQALGTTYDCKTANCDGEAWSKVGRYSYCDYCRDQRARQQPTITGGTFSDEIKQLAKLASNVDKLRATATRKTSEALAAKAAADKAEEILRSAVRTLGNN